MTSSHDQPRLSKPCATFPHLGFGRKQGHPRAPHHARCGQFDARPGEPVKARACQIGQRAPPRAPDRSTSAMAARGEDLSGVQQILRIEHALQVALQSDQLG